MRVLIGTEVDFSGKGKEIRKSTIWWLGRTFANPRTRVALEL
jgi:hypothetical protein